MVVVFCGLYICFGLGVFWDYDCFYDDYVVNWNWLGIVICSVVC